MQGFCGFGLRQGLTREGLDSTSPRDVDVAIRVVLFSRVRVVRRISSGNGEFRPICLLFAQLTTASWGK
jgi:hypothetical protein